MGRMGKLRDGVSLETQNCCPVSHVGQWSKEVLAHLVGGSLNPVEGCGKQGKREQGRQFLSESRLPPSSLEACGMLRYYTLTISGLYLNASGFLFG